MPKQQVFDLYFFHPKYGHGRLDQLFSDGKATVTFSKHGQKTIYCGWLEPTYYTGAESGLLGMLLSGGQLAKGRRSSSQLLGRTKLHHTREQVTSAEDSVVGP